MAGTTHRKRATFTVGLVLLSRMDKARTVLAVFDNVQIIKSYDPLLYSSDKLVTYFAYASLRFSYPLEISKK